MSQTRADFLAAGALAAFVPAVAGAQTPSPAPSADAAAHIPPLSFDLSAFDAATGKPAAHRHLFASTKLEDGDVLYAVQNTLDAYALLKIPAASVGTAVVLYHGASIGMAFDDAVWKELLIPAIPKLSEHIRAEMTGYKSAVGNPFLRSTESQASSVESLVKAATLFFVCNNATAGFAHLLANIAKQPARATYDRLVAGLVPGATLVPAGVWAVHALQERRYTYLQATL